MARVRISTNLSKIMMTSLVLIFIGTFTIIFLGILMHGLDKEVKELEFFMDEAKTTQPNFEKSLEIYTDQTEKVINYLLGLRPSREAEYVDFISQIEDIGHNLSLNLDLESIRFSKEEDDGTLNYMITFQGGMMDLERFLKQLEALPYYIRVKEVDFRNPKYLSEDELEHNNNITIKIGLYTK